MEREIRLVFMGVCGCGKTTLARRVAAYLGCGDIIEADEFHTPEMKKKMASGVPLTDEDRWPWLERLNEAMRQVRRPWTVVTCSALRKVYREKLACGLTESVIFILLRAPKELIRERMLQRQHEYMPVSLLESQFATLEAPSPDESVIEISVEGTEEESFKLLTREIERLSCPSAL